MGNYTIFEMFEKPRRGRQARKLTTNVPNILDLKSSSEQIFPKNCRWVPLFQFVDTILAVTVLWVLVFSVLILFHFIFDKSFTARFSRLSFSLWIQSQLQCDHSNNKVSQLSFNFFRWTSQRKFVDSVENIAFKFSKN